jgi:hypothetical protein
MSLAGGAIIFGVFIVLFTLAVIFSYYTRRGSGINQRSYNDVYGNSPGAKIPSTLGHDKYSNVSSRGTKKYR